MKIKKGDSVIVISGKDKGKTGKVVRALPSLHRVIVDGVNVRITHERPRRSGQKGQIVKKTVPLDVSNVALVDPKTGKPTRVGKKLAGEKRVRYAKKSGTLLEK